MFRVKQLNKKLILINATLRKKTAQSKKESKGSGSYLRLSCDDEEDRSDWGRDTMLSELFR